MADTPLALVTGCAGPGLNDEERHFFRDANPLGFILFQRNCETPDQVRALVAACRDAVGRDDAPVLIDQEGGRVQRLGPPHWRAAPAARVFAELFETDPAWAAEAAYLNALLIGRELAELGITVDCAPVLDVPQPGAHDIIGDRAYGLSPEPVAVLGRAVCDGLLGAAVLPVIKHLPGHGRAGVDSHLELPLVDASRHDLEEIDFAPFRALADMPWAMTAHVVYSALDETEPATASAPVVDGIIRRGFGFDGVLVSDDIGMKALSGGFGDRACRALAAGCDVALHCSGAMDEMAAAAAGARPMTAAAMARLHRAEALRTGSARDPMPTAEARARLDILLED